MHEHDMHEDGAARSLHSIEAGGQHLLMLSRRRMFEIMDEIDRGDFREAHATAQQLANTLAPLASAQAYIAIADGSKLVAARDLTVGMVLTEVGEITEHEVTDCPAPRCRGHVKLKIGEHEAQYPGDVELYVQVAEKTDEESVVET